MTTDRIFLLEGFRWDLITGFKYPKKAISGIHSLLEFLVGVCHIVGKGLGFIDRSTETDCDKETIV